MTEKKNGFVEFFSKDILMLFSMIIAVIASVVQAGMNSKIISYFNAFTFAVNAICVLVLFISYKKHDKNIMKGIMGAIFMLMLLRSADTFCSYLQSIAEPTLLRVIFGGLVTLLILILMVNHFLINGDRHSRPWNVKFNQIIFIVLMITELVVRLYYIIISDSVFLRVSYLVSIFTVISTICLLICVETKLEGYKALREANGWVEEPYSSAKSETAENTTES